MLSTQDRSDIAQSVREANAIGQQAQREVQQVVAQTNRELAQHGSGGPGVPGISGDNTSVLRDNAGRIVVTGPSGKTIVIDPKAGLDGDQIQAMVQTALQPPSPPHNGPDIPREAIPIVAIVFTFLFLIAIVISRTVSGRRRFAEAAPAALSPEATARLARIEQAVEAVAIEVERISEAQRYSAQLLTDRLPDAGAVLGPTSASPAARG